MTTSSYDYTTYIEGSAERVWGALTSPDDTARFWGHSNRSDWKRGSRWVHVRPDGSEIVDVEGTVLESRAPNRLTITFDQPHGEPSIVTFEIEGFHEIVRFRVIHKQLPDESDWAEVAHAWPAVAANLKTLIETGETLSSAPWEAPRKS